MNELPHTVNVHYVGFIHPIHKTFMPMFIDYMARTCTDDWHYDIDTCTMYFKSAEDATRFRIRMVVSSDQTEALHTNFYKCKIIGDKFLKSPEYYCSYIPIDRDYIQVNLLDWLDNDCEEPWCYRDNHLFFVSQRDAALFRMTWL